MSLIHEVSDIFQNQKFPRNWKTIELNKILKIQNGFAFKSSNFNSDKIGMPLIRIRDIKNSTMETFYSGAILEDFIVIEGDLIIGMDGDFNSNLWKGSPALLNQRVCRLIPDENLILKKLLYYGLPSYLNKINENTSSTTVKHLSSKSIGEIPFPLPPLAEQNRIVTKLDALFKQLETIKMSMTAIPVLLKNFRHQVLTQAVTGKLTEEWRKGKELEENILIASQKFDFAFEIKSVPKNWVKHPIGNIFSFQQGMQIAKSTRFTEPKENTLPILRIKNYHDGFQTDVEHIEVDEKSLIAEPEDIILTRTGESRGWVLSGFKGVFHNNTFRINFPKDKIINSYLKYYLSSNEVQNFIKISSGRTGQPDLTHKSFGPCPILIPPYLEQQEIVRRIESLFTKAEAIEQQYKSLKEKIDSLPQALLHKAFKGELTEQLDSDGDAKELLKQIQELKNSAVKPKKATTKKVKNYPEGNAVLGMVAETKEEYPCK